MNIFTTSEHSQVNASNNLFSGDYEIFVHNHPSGDARPNGIKDAKIIGGDLLTAKEYPKIRYYIYVKGNSKYFPKGYYGYDKNGIKKQNFEVKSDGTIIYKPVKLQF